MQTVKRVTLNFWNSSKIWFIAFNEEMFLSWNRKKKFSDTVYITINPSQQQRPKCPSWPGAWLLEAGTRGEAGAGDVAVPKMLLSCCHAWATVLGQILRLVSEYPRTYIYVLEPCQILSERWTRLSVTGFMTFVFVGKNINVGARVQWWYYYDNNDYFIINDR